MTWFRGMERRGFTIHWIDATLSMEDKIDHTLAAITAFLKMTFMHKLSKK
jgi:tRNA dimethylallyltransferase